MNAKRGVESERKCVEELEKQGFHVSRSAASRGSFDIIAVNCKEVRFIQVKRTSAKSRMFMKKDIELLRGVRVPNHPCIRKQLWCWLDYKGWSIQDII